MGIGADRTAASMVTDKDTALQTVACLRQALETTGQDPLDLSVSVCHRRFWRRHFSHQRHHRGCQSEA